MSKYPRYQDYVIKEGKLVAEFEQMYVDFDDPWEQSTREQFAIEKQVTLETVKQQGFKRVLEYGCGLGHFSGKLSNISEAVLGVDISNTAISKARMRYPNVSFKQADILDWQVIKEFQPDCIILAEISWYVLEKLPVFRRYIRDNLQGCGFIHLLNTYAQGKQAYGNDYFTNLTEIMGFWSDIEFEEWGEFSRKDLQGNKRTFCFGFIK